MAQKKNMAGRQALRCSSSAIVGPKESAVITQVDSFVAAQIHRR
jgi:hypothetical protein